MEYFIEGLAAVPEPKDPIIKEAIQIAAEGQGVPPLLLRSVAYHESRYKTDAISNVGAQGLFQLMPRTAAQLGVDPWNPAQAADGAARLLSGWRRKYRGSWAHALAAYVWGPAKVDRAGGFGSTQWPQEVRTFVQRVLEGARMPVPFSGQNIRLVNPSQ